MELANLGKIFLVIGSIIVLSGLAISVFGKIGFTVNLPGDVLIQKGNLTFYSLIVTFLILSLVLTILVDIVIRLFN